MNITTASLLIFTLVIGLSLGFWLGWLRTRLRVTERLAAAEAENRMLTGRAEEMAADARVVSELTHAVGPLAAGVKALHGDVTQADRQRIAQLSELQTQIAQLSAQNLKLQESTTSLAGALHSTTARGDWGEVQLRRIVEYAGMLPHVDFDSQLTVVNEGTKYRPDLVVHLPGGGALALDAKTPLAARLKDEADDRLAHAKALLRHVDHLASKEYWKALRTSPDFVICFIPTDGLLSAAAAAYPRLVEQALAKNVVLASPSTLLVLLKTVALNWRQFEISTSAQEVLRLGRELYERTGALAGNLTKLGTSLDKAVTDYNRFIGSFESRFLVTARKFPTTGVVEGELQAVASLDSRARGISVEELTRPLSAEEEGSSKPNSA